VEVSRQWSIEIEKGKPRAEIGLVLRTLAALDLTLSVDPETVASTLETDAVPSIDIDAILDELGSERS